MSNVHTLQSTQTKYVTEKTHNHVRDVQGKYIIQLHNALVECQEENLELKETIMEKDFIIEDLAKGDNSPIIEVVTGGEAHVENFVKQYITYKMKSLGTSKEREAEIRAIALKKSAMLKKKMLELKQKNN